MRIKNKAIFKNWKLIFVFFNVAAAMFFINGPTPLIATRYSDFEVAEWSKPLLLLFTSLPYFLTSVGIQFLTKKLTPLTLTCIGYSTLVVGELFLGPSKILGFPDSIYMILGGQCFYGFSYACLIVPSIPLMERYAFVQPSAEKERAQIINFLSSAFNSLFSLGALTGSFVTPFIAKPLGFRSTLDVLALATLVYGILFALSMLVVPDQKEDQKKDQSTHLLNASEIA